MPNLFSFVTRKAFLVPFALIVGSLCAALLVYGLLSWELTTCAPATSEQRCVIYQMRNTGSFISHIYAQDGHLLSLSGYRLHSWSTSLPTERGARPYFVAQNMSNTGDIRCELRIGDQIIAEDRTSEPYGMAICTGIVP